MNVRAVALDIINKVLNEQSYSNILLNQTINENKVKDLDVGLLTELVYGTINYKLTLDYYLKDFIENKKVNNTVLNVLRMSLYQMKYLDKIPNHAIINEAVMITKNNHHQRVANFVNAVLRNISRNGVKSVSDIDDDIDRLSIETSHPKWLINLWTKQFDFNTAKKITDINNSRPYQFVRLNLYKDTKENILKKLTDLKIDYYLVDGVNEAIYLKKDNIANVSMYREGYLNIQDVSSMLVSKILAPLPNETIIDVCAAPGGKSTHIAQLMNNKGEVISCDIYEHKLDLIRYNAKRLGLSIIKPILVDAQNLTNHFKENSFDRVLVDAPCSGFGVIRRKPEIKYNKKPSDLDEIIKLQKAIIDEAIKLVKPNGTLVYSTCTINKKENEKMVEYILNNYPDFRLDEKPFKKNNLGDKGYLQIINQINGADIFFISCFKKTSKN